MSPDENPRADDPEDEYVDLTPRRPPVSALEDTTPPEGPRGDIVEVLQSAMRSLGRRDWENCRTQTEQAESLLASCGDRAAEYAIQIDAIWEGFAVREMQVAAHAYATPHKSSLEVSWQEFERGLALAQNSLRRCRSISCEAAGQMRVLRSVRELHRALTLLMKHDVTVKDVTRAREYLAAARGQHALAGSVESPAFAQDMPKRIESLERRAANVLSRLQERCS